MIRSSVWRIFTSNLLAGVRLRTYLLLNGGVRRHGAKADR
jgi:hypothetical protein